MMDEEPDDEKDEGRDDEKDEGRNDIARDGDEVEEGEHEDDIDRRS